MILFLTLFSLLFSFEERHIHVKEHKIYVQVAKNDSERAQGLMHRKSWGKYQGMLFIFDKEERLSFWMKNTFLTLSIGFFNANLVLIDIQDMQPHKGKGPLPSYRSNGLAKYALEVPIGWFQEKGVGLGSRLRLE